VTQPNRLLLVGWDSADWRILDPLLAAGAMPALASLIARGVRGNLATDPCDHSPDALAAIYSESL
jgi:predicted AlkP superfamily phosphohydrolase/phosphomutase